MSIERIWYETSPYLYAVGGIATAVDAGSLLMKGSGLILFTAALTILGLRWIYRHDEARSRRRLASRRHANVVTQDLFYDGIAKRSCDLDRKH